MQRIPGSNKGSGDPEPVTGPLGSGTVAMSAVGVARDEQRAAAVSANQQYLYVSSLTEESEPARPCGDEHGEEGRGPAVGAELGRPG